MTMTLHFSLDKKLTTAETKHKFVRWQKDSDCLKAVLAADELRRQEVYLQKIKALVSEKQILQEAHRKHAGVL